MIKLSLLGAMIGLPLGLLAQADGGTGGNLPPWVNYGVLGLVIVAIIVRQIVPGWLYADVKKENEELRAENKRLVDLNLETQAATAPALASATNAINEILTEVRMMRRGS